MSNYKLVSSLPTFKADLLPAGGSLGRMCIYRKGAFLWSRGAPLSSVFVVRRGEVEITVPGPGPGAVVRRVKAGEICGLFSFCESRRDRAHSSGRAAVRTEALQIPHAEFREFLARTPDVLFAVLATACERLAFAEDRIHVLTCRGAEDRILTLLLQLGDRSGNSWRDDGSFILHYTHAELASFAAMTRSHVSTVLARLRESGVVEYDRGKALRVSVRAALEFLRARRVRTAA